ncbi:class I SAM-dependent methyltransferase family protein [Nanoarchaeota archaeon]
MKMVLCVKTPLKNAQQVKQFLVENGLFDYSYRFRRTKTHIFFPVSKKTGIKKQFRFTEFTDIKLQEARKKETFKQVITKKLSKAELVTLRRAFDIIGTIAIVEIPDELVKKEKLLAETLLALQKNVKTVLKKAGIHGTEFRTQPMKYLAGEKTKETISKEQGVRLKLNVEKVYFSPRLSTERKRIASQVKPGEDVLVMFSGCAPYPCVIARTTKAGHITGIEINPAGHRYGEENIKLNKIDNIKLYNADVRKAVPKLKKRFDRIVMPLPKSAGDFLETAFKAAKRGTTIHFYAFEEQGHFKDAVARVKTACKKNGLRCRILRTVKCGQHAPRTFRICVDFRII